MKLAYVTHYDSRFLGGKQWSGTGYYIAQALLKQAISLDYFGPLIEPKLLKYFTQVKRAYYNKLQAQKVYLPNADPWILKNYARQVKNKLAKSDADLVFSATHTATAYLECNRPTAFWADATFARLHNFYKQYSNLHETTVKEWHQREKIALENCSLAIYSSDWAARSAIDYYGADPNKVKVVPFGANIDDEMSFENVAHAIESRPSNVCKFLFLGVAWERKGGNTAYEVVKKLNASGLNAELTVVGCQPLLDEPLPDFVKPLGFISKSTKEGKMRLRNLIAESHFLLLPVRAECYGIVFCEANSFGVPCIARAVGGVPTIIRNGINGQLFDQDADISEYCEYITKVFNDDYSKYKALAFSSFNEYHNRLSWDVGGKTVYKLLSELL